MEQSLTIQIDECLSFDVSCFGLAADEVKVDQSHLTLLMWLLENPEELDLHSRSIASFKISHHFPLAYQELLMDLGLYLKTHLANPDWQDQTQEEREKRVMLKERMCVDSLTFQADDAECKIKRKIKIKVNETTTIVTLNFDCVEILLRFKNGKNGLPGCGEMYLHGSVYRHIGSSTVQIKMLAFNKFYVGETTWNEKTKKRFMFGILPETLIGNMTLDVEERQVIANGRFTNGVMEGKGTVYDYKYHNIWRGEFVNGLPVDGRPPFKFTTVVIKKPPTVRVYSFWSTDEYQDMVRTEIYDRVDEDIYDRMDEDRADVDCIDEGFEGDTETDDSWRVVL
jgi:hypothetical protein